MTRPIRIGVTMDVCTEGSFSTREHYALRTHYFKAIAAGGCIPYGIPHERASIPAYLDDIDGLLVPGGGFASPESWYETRGAELPYKPSSRLEFDLAIIEQALHRDIPILGICAGMQLLGGLTGCKMTHNVHERYTTDIDHMKGAPAEEYCHDIHIVAGTILASIYACDTARVNSAHREAVICCPEGVVISAYAPDSVIEAIELPDKRFALGVQWHPEFFDDDPVICAFIRAAKIYKEQNAGSNA